MKRLLILTFICLISAFVKVQGKSSSTPIIYIDGNGVMRWSDTRREASFFGVNYTLPFAHAYRAIGYLELDRKAAIEDRKSTRLNSSHPPESRMPSSA